jgi:hypothetical protein
LDRRELLRRLARNPHNVRFADLLNLLDGLGFELQRTSGSHRIFKHPRVPTLINLQEFRGDAKAYQVRQLLKLVEKYNLELKD